MATAPCRKRHEPTGRSCLQSLAGGWSIPTDLCSACTTRFMAALDALGEPLVWHEGYVRRAVGGA